MRMSAPDPAGRNGGNGRSAIGGIAAGKLLLLKLVGGAACSGREPGRSPADNGIPARVGASA